MDSLPGGLVRPCLFVRIKLARVILRCCLTKDIEMRGEEQGERGERNRRKEGERNELRGEREKGE